MMIYVPRYLFVFRSHFYSHELRRVENMIIFSVSVLLGVASFTCAALLFLHPLPPSLLCFWVVSPGSTPGVGGVSQAELQQCVGGLTSYPLFPLLSSTHPPFSASLTVFRVSQRCSESERF